MSDDRKSRGAFEGLTDEEIEEEYRKNREYIKEQNKPINRVKNGAEYLINQTKSDIKRSPNTYYVLLGIIIGMAVLWVLIH